MMNCPICKKKIISRGNFIPAKSKRRRVVVCDYALLALCKNCTEEYGDRSDTRIIELIES